MLRAILLEVTAVVAMFCVVGAVTLVGPSRLAALRTELRPRLRESAPYLAVLIVVLILNSITRDSAQSLSWQIGYEITYLLAEYDTGVVATIQSFESQALTTYFSSVYVYGYVFVLVFPVLAYVALSDRKHFQRLVVAYSINYFVGLTLYILFVAYGPRNWYGIEVGAEAAKVVYENQLYGLTGEGYCKRVTHKRGQQPNQRVPVASHLAVGDSCDLRLQNTRDLSGVVRDRDRTCGQHHHLDDVLGDSLGRRHPLRPRTRRALGVRRRAIRRLTRPPAVVLS